MNNPFRSGYNMPDNCFSTPYDDEKCPRCDRTNVDLIDIGDDDYVCEYCIEDYVECMHCGSYFEEDDGSEVESVCQDCFNEYYFECPICGKHKLKDDNEHYDIDGNVLCDECYEDLKHL